MNENTASLCNVAEVALTPANPSGHPRQSEALRDQLAQLVEGAQDAILAKNLDGIVTFWNAGAARLYGYPAEEIVGKSVSILMPSERREELLKLIRRVVGGEAVGRYETERLTKSGQRSYVSLALSPIRDAGGAIVAISTIAHDITERRRAEEDLQAASLYCRSLIEASLDPLVTISREGRIADVNRATEEATGLPREQLVGTSFADFFTDRKEASAAYQAAFANGSVTAYPLALRHRSGTVMDVLYNATVYHDQKGEVAGVFAAARNVTARKRAEEARTRANRALRMVNTCNNIMIRAADEARLLEDTCRAIVEVGGYKLAWIGYAEEDAAKSVRPIAHFGTNGDYVAAAEISWSDTDERGRGSIGTAIRTGTAVVARDSQIALDFTPCRRRAEEAGYRSSATTPLRANDKVYGALTVYSGEPDAFDAEEMNLLAELADDLSFATAALRTKVAHEKSEQEVARAARYMRSLLEVSLDPLVTISPEGRITDVNEAVIAATGVPREKLIGSDFSNYFTDAEKARQGYREVFDKGFVSDYPLSIRHLSGKTTDVLYNARVYRDEGGAVAGVFAAARDITDRHRMEAELQLSEERYRTLVVATAQLVWTTDPSGKVVGDMPNWRSFTGQSVEAIQGDGWAAALHPDDREPTLNVWLRAVAARTTYDTEYRIRRHDGEYRHVSVRGVPVLETDGTIREWVGVCTDITERKQAETELRSSRERLALALKAGRAGTFDWNIRSNVNHWSPEIEDLYGVPRGKFGGTFEAWAELVFPEDLAAAHAAIDASLETGSFSGEWRVRRPDGSIVWLAASATVLFGADGRPDRMIGVNFDITARKQAEDEVHRLNTELERRVAERTTQLEAANKELEAFSYSVSHDLRTPLRAIDGFSRIVLEDYSDKLDAEGRRLLNVVHESTVKMSGLIDDILAFSRAGRTEMHPQPVDMEALVRTSLAETLAPAMAGRNIALDIGTLPSAQGDRAMLERVWVNLLDNAVKFTGSKLDARIEIGATAGNSETIYQVRDNGAGFDMQYAGKLFGVFQRLHGAEFPGTGIGLAIVKRIITRHGGRVWAEGKPAEGATFYFTLPKEETRHA